MEDRKKAFEVAANMGMNYYTSLAFHWLDNIPKPKGMPEWPTKIPEPTPEMVEAMTAEGYAVIGDPDDCLKSVEKWREVGFDQLTFSPTTNLLPTEVVVQSMELFGREVIPLLDKDPVHSTTKYRQAASSVSR
jgi:alkanesulfonate monooxygenase SsuD/methylene tetrahydromethanopterin reductase-like flavin-dependent oxidoreductase (luciferase family)